MQAESFRALVVSLFERGGPLMWPLLACSLASLTVTIERLLFWWRQARRNDDRRLDRVFQLTEGGEYDAALELGGARAGVFLSVLRAGLVHREHGLTEAMEVRAADEIARMKQGMGVLDTVITMAPLLGILGTVIGIIESFELLGNSGIEDPKAVTGGIAQALITTAAGLSVALITLIPFNYLVAKVERAARQIERIATQFAVAYRRSLPAAGGEDGDGPR
jgi:biopolymer transport protein ExbB